MALASGHWIRKEVTGQSPNPRYGHALAIAGNIAFLFGGCAFHNTTDDKLTYFNDFYMLTITPTDLTWEKIPQDGHIPSSRQGHSLCVVKGKIYLFGGCSSKNAECCLPGIYTFDLGSLTWEKLTTNGIAPQTLKHSSAVVGENIYIYGGIKSGKAVDDLYVFNTVSQSWTPVKTSGLAPGARSGHAFATIGEVIYMFGGCSNEDEYCTNVFALDTVSLTWRMCEVKGERPIGRSDHTFTAHHDKLYIFGGVNEKEFNDLVAMKLINPSDRQPIMKEILSELGIQGISNRFTPTKIPKVKYELTDSPLVTESVSPPPPVPTAQLQDFHSVRNQAMDMITRAFALLDTEFQKLNVAKAELAQATMVFQHEKEQYNIHFKKQRKELQEMLEKHRAQNEAWLSARAEENDKERKELYKLREEILHDQERLRDEQQSIHQRNQQLLSIMQQFKGM